MFSFPHRVSSGVPQGSILAPLLFILFTANAASLPLTSRLYMYADDMLLVNSFKHNEAFTISSLVSDLQSISDWSVSNGLHLNPFKSFYMIVGSPSFLSRTSALNIHLNSMPIASPPSMRVLSLHIDPSWSFDHHVTVKCRATYARLHKLYPLCHVLSISQKLNYLSSPYLITLTRSTFLL